MSAPPGVPPGDASGQSQAPGGQQQFDPAAQQQQYAAYAAAQQQYGQYGYGGGDPYAQQQQFGGYGGQQYGQYGGQQYGGGRARGVPSPFRFFGRRSRGRRRRGALFSGARQTDGMP